MNRDQLENIVTGAHLLLDAASVKGTGALEDRLSALLHERDEARAREVELAEALRELLDADMATSEATSTGLDRRDSDAMMRLEAAYVDARCRARDLVEGVERTPTPVEDEESAERELSRLEDDLLEIHDALVAGGIDGNINAPSIIERIEQATGQDRERTHALVPVEALQALADAVDSAVLPSDAEWKLVGSARAAARGERVEWSA